jgi:hypothetical protein
MILAKKQTGRRVLPELRAAAAAAADLQLEYT